MTDQVKQLRIFIACPSDCAVERDAIHHICQTDLTIKHLRRDLKVSIDQFDFRDLPSNLGRPQSLINEAIDRWRPDWYVFIFWHRMGTDAGLGMTGMEEEWNRASQLNLTGNGCPWVSLYFNQVDPPIYQIDPGQREALTKFKASIFDQHKAFAANFSGTQDFQERFRADLTYRLQELSHGVGAFDLKQQFLESSKGLLGWPRTLGAQQEIDRPEFHLLVEKMLTSETSTTLILGGPGSGKSALLSKLGNEFIRREVVVLAIKADMLGRRIKNHEDLRLWLNVGLEIGDAVRMLAQSGRVIVLIDQLDAVAELTDRHSERLNLLLNLIHRLSGRNRVHIIAASREFEYRHDARLTSIDADRLDLQLPNWDQISPILVGAGHNPTVMAEPMRELLRPPWHLKLFLENAKPGMEFVSIQSLLEEVWKQRILNTDGPPNRGTLLEKLAAKMAKDEVLWLPSSMADRWAQARQALERSDILARGPGGTSLGFRHQTYYDHTLARAFASGTLSLNDHVKAMQNGLFIRPSLLSGLHYLRGTSQSEYHRQLKKLMGKSFRLHIRSLLVEYLGEQREPDDTEAAIMVPLLNGKEGPRVLAAVAGSVGWFERLSHQPQFFKWMQNPTEMAMHCVNILCQATAFLPDKVLDLLESNWLNKHLYDRLSFRVFSYFTQWTPRTVDLVCPLLRRYEEGSASLLVDKVSESAPDLAPIVMRAHLDCRLNRAREISTKIRSGQTLTASEEMQARRSSNGPKGPFINLIAREEDWYNLDSIAESAPKAFLDSIWPWFVDVVSEIAYDEHDFLFEYRDDIATYNKFDGELPQGPIIKALLVAVTAVAKDTPDAFVNFLNHNSSSDLLIVHRYLSRGLQCIVAQKPKLILDYLCADPRRLQIGDFSDHHRETKALIAAVCPHLSPGGAGQLEERVINFKREKTIKPEWTPQERFERSIWNRQHRLRLLRAFPAASLSGEGQELLEQEERAFPNVNDRDSDFHGGWVGPRITASEMERASNEDILHLFDKLPDQTRWDNPSRRFRLDHSRGGGAIQQSRELGELAKTNPNKVLGLIEQLEPSKHETYAGAALRGLASSSILTNDLIALIERLDDKGFSDEDFRNGASSALAQRASEKGLPQPVLDRLETWLTTHPIPEWRSGMRPEERRKEQDEQGDTILYGHGAIWASPHGRGPIIEAIAFGYLRQQPADYSNWARVIESRLGKENHPAIWVVTIKLMPELFNWDRSKASILFDRVIKTCPDVLRYDFSVFSIAHILRFSQPKEIAQNWIKLLSDDRSNAPQQLHGEMLFLYHCCFNDGWSRKQVSSLMSNKQRKRALLGLAHGASHLWKHSNCRKSATQVLTKLARSRNPLILHAVTDLFRLHREDFDLNPEIRRIINEVTKNRLALKAVAGDLVERIVPFAATDPKLALSVCEAVLRLGQEVVSKYGLYSVAESLTTIALTLHRQERYRAAGLRMFEKLLLMNVNEARAALEILDRKPTQKVFVLPSRRRRKRTTK